MGSKKYILCLETSENSCICKKKKLLIDELSVCQRIG